MGYTVPTRELLDGVANVHRAPANCGPTSRGVERIDAWLGDGRWDVIHFNFGLHDLKIMEDGKHQVAIDQYEANLRRIVVWLKQTDARLIWAATTPVPDAEVSPPRSDEDVVAYNAVGKRIMQEHGIGIDDLYSFALPRLAEIQQPANVHFTPDGSRALAEKVAQCIAEALAGK
jgi:acyl-CoA thioesterase-1